MGFIARQHSIWSSIDGMTEDAPNPSANVGLRAAARDRSNSVFSLEAQGYVSCGAQHPLHPCERDRLHPDRPCALRRRSPSPAHHPGCPTLALIAAYHKWWEIESTIDEIAPRAAPLARPEVR